MKLIPGEKYNLTHIKHFGVLSDIIGSTAIFHTFEPLGLKGFTGIVLVIEKDFDKIKPLSIIPYNPH